MSKEMRKVLLTRKAETEFGHPRSYSSPGVTHDLATGFRGKLPGNFVKAAQQPEGRELRDDRLRDGGQSYLVTLVQIAE